MNPIEQAKAYVDEKVLAPALASDSLPKEVKYKVRNSRIWLSKFKRVGDLLQYLNRFDAADSEPLYLSLKEHGLLTFEEIRDDFQKRFELWATDRTRSTDFVIGEQYGSHEILIFARTYDTRSGGIFLLPKQGGKPTGVVIKATLQAGAYPNQWIEPGRRLKYFFKAIKEKFEDHFEVNAAILSNAGIPILAFVRPDPDADFTYFGVFELVKPHKDSNGSKWFELALASSQPKDVFAEAAFVHKQLADGVARSTSDARQARLERLKLAPKKPPAVAVVATQYVRNPDVVAETLFLAAGLCGACGNEAPFKRASDGTPYLEVHHKTPLAQGGEDTIDNAVALCPNCHRQRHFG